MRKEAAFFRVGMAAGAALAVLVATGDAAPAPGLQLAAGEAPVTSAVPLEDTYWKLTEFDGAPYAGASSSADAHVIFRASGKFAGYAICNSLFSSYTHDDSVLTLKPIGVTTRGCADPADDEREQRLVAALRRARGWRIEGVRLALLDEHGGVVARFQAVAQ